MLLPGAAPSCRSGPGRWSTRRRSSAPRPGSSTAPNRHGDRGSRGSGRPARCARSRSCSRIGGEARAVRRGGWPGPRESAVARPMIKPQQKGREKTAARKPSLTDRRHNLGARQVTRPVSGLDLDARPRWLGYACTRNTSGPSCRPCYNHTAGNHPEPVANPWAGCRSNSSPALLVTHRSTS